MILHYDEHGRVRAYEDAYGTPRPFNGGASLDGFDGIGSIVKKAIKGAKRAATFIAAPLVVPTAALVKGATWTVAQTHIPGTKALDRKVADAWNSGTVKNMRSDATKQAVVGAAVGTAIFAAPFVGSAVSSVGGSASTLGVEAAKKAGKDLALKAVQAGAKGALEKGTTEVEVDPTLTPETIAKMGGRPSAGSGGLLLGAGVGFAFAGPVGALIGAVAGSMLNKQG